MKKILLLCSLWFSLLTVCAQTRLTINDCQTKAKEYFPLVKRYGLIEKTKEYNLSNAEKGYLPQISLNLKASYQSEVIKFPLNIPLASGVNGLSKDQYQGTIDINQSIWDGGAISSQKKIIQAGAALEQEQLHVELYQLKERINQLYFGILLLDAQLVQNEMMQEDLQRNYCTIASYVKGGVANQTDLDAVRVEELKMKQQQVKICSNRRAYLEMLAAMTGDSLNESSILIKPDTEKIPLDKTINRPELQMFEAQHIFLEKQKEMIAANNRPRLGLFIQGGYGRPGLNPLDDKLSPFAIGGIRLAWNFGSFYTEKNERRKLEINQHTVAAEKELFLYNTNLEMTRESNEIKHLKELVKYDDEIIMLRENVRKSAEAKVQNGTLTVLELMREMTAENLAKQDKITHDIELLLAIYNWENMTNN